MDLVEKFLTPPELALLLKISVRTLEGWRARGHGPPWTCIGRRVVYDREAVLAWTAQETRGPAKAPQPMHKTVKEVTACPYTKDSSRWHVDMIVPHPITGSEIRKRRVAPPGLTLEDALRWGASERLRIVTELARAPQTSEQKEEEPRRKSNPTVPTIAELWTDFEVGHIAKKARRTQKGYGAAKRHILRSIGDKRVDAITHVEMEMLKDALEVKRLGGATIRFYLKGFAKFLRWAMSKGKAPMAPVPEVEVHTPKRRLQVYSREELENFVETTTDVYERALALVLADGVLRIGEVAGLQWGDIVGESMHIVRHVTDGCLFDSTKSGEDGVVPLSPRLVQALRKLRATRLDPLWVFPRRPRATKPRLAAANRARAEARKKTSTMANDRTLAQLVSYMQNRAGLEPHGPHRVRHSRLTHLAETGLPLRALQMLARHSSEKTTERYYVHVNKYELAKKAVEAISTLSTRRPQRSGNGLETPGNESRNPVLN